MKLFVGLAEHVKGNNLLICRCGRNWSELSAKMGGIGTNVLLEFAKTVCLNSGWDC